MPEEDADVNYFTCTLGQAAQLRNDASANNNPQDAATTTTTEFTNIPAFIAQQASRAGHLPAVAFPIPPPSPTPSSSTTPSSAPSPSPWSHNLYTFSSLHQHITLLSCLLNTHLSTPITPGETIALLCPSSPALLFAWLALMRLGAAVLLVAPQCEARGVVELCRNCGVRRMVVWGEGGCGELGREVEGLVKKEEVEVWDLRRVWREAGEGGEQGKEGGNGEEVEWDGLPGVGPNDIAYLHHTSGTSSGVPNPIPQTHAAGLGVLPRLSGSGRRKATFSTTPLYHGGVADVFRAWTSDALIWLFPAKDRPITAANIISSLDTTKSVSESSGGKIPLVRYFSSVPYVLQMMAAEKRGMEHLTSMDIVGVGGAALPAEVGDGLVRKGVNLVSRFGSAECGFLMSSHREYEKDKEWQYLRSSKGSDALKFEERENGLAELVVLKGWPHMAKTNRPIGSFATADLFAPHHTISNAWKYHSRADSQLTLITGKKFDPAPLEAALSTHAHLADALIFGNGRPFPGVLLFRSEKSAGVADRELLDAVRPVIEKLNAGSQTHAKIPGNMLVPMPYSQSALEKSSKGTVMRGKAEERYSQTVEEAYGRLDTAKGGGVADEDVLTHITTLVQDIVTKPGKLEPGTDLFSYGVDSVACMQIRYGLRQLLPEDSGELPLSIVEDCGTVQKLHGYVLRKRHGEAIEDEEDEHELMLSLAEQYGTFDDTGAAASHTATNGTQPTPKPTKDVVVLTGATGALGAHILAQHLSNDSVDKIYCLVRGSDHHAAVSRVDKALQQRGLPGLRQDDTGSHVSNTTTSSPKLVVLQCDLSSPSLGLSRSDYTNLAHTATTIIHVAWAVNFRMRLRSFVKDNIAGLHHLLNLALSAPGTPPKFIYCSSTASVTNTHATNTSAVIPESVSTDPSTSSPLGYSRSKWVAEAICHRAHQQTRLRSRIAVARVGQLAGDTVTGVWNTQEAWPMMLGTVKLIGALPALRDEPLSWLPVDVAAKALVQGVGSIGCCDEKDGDGGMQVLHVLNEWREPGWMELLGWLEGWGERFEEVEPGEWVRRLERERERERDGGSERHAAFKLLGLWKQAYGEDGAGGKKGDTETQTGTDTGPRFSMEKSKMAAPVLRDVKPVDEAYFAKIWAWLQAEQEK
ncbi:hypothetical protein K490DRAFT_34564 [Saccharata proteae CBS 121410]|uniref:Carrier domain-containing protein n=1 Tax=Saccharata proteae CBS 121410 TaxID=1314787 RepID=A0A9P4I0P7_9PEZI|nr:hypothetical protein K490DRAFT_34564 [Saccharata proteae CBS 121410]